MHQIHQGPAIRKVSLMLSEAKRSSDTRFTIVCTGFGGGFGHFVACCAHKNSCSCHGFSGPTFSGRSFKFGFQPSALVPNTNMNIASFIQAFIRLPAGNRGSSFSLKWGPPLQYAIEYYRLRKHETLPMSTFSSRTCRVRGNYTKDLRTLTPNINMPSATSCLLYLHK